MKLVIGLGNPGSDYLNTRHNVAFFVVDELKVSKLPKDVVVKKSDVFMNDSGSFVKKLADQYKLNPKDLFIIHDDLDIKLGEYKIQFGHGPRDHNGLNDIYKKLGTENFWHIRIGIDNRPLDSRPMGIEYVLQNFTEEEMKTIESVTAEAANELCKKLAT
jgi:PTH1 family peptidyl-tRNA hydrolase